MAKHTKHYHTATGKRITWRNRLFVARQILVGKSVIFNCDVRRVELVDFGNKTVLYGSHVRDEFRITG